jgi:hypothetical protein
LGRFRAFGGKVQSKSPERRLRESLGDFTMNFAIIFEDFLKAYLS